MRILALTLALALLAGAPAGAQQVRPAAEPQFQGGRIVVPSTPGSLDGMAKASAEARKSAPISEAPAAWASTPAPLPPMLAPLARPSNADGGACRLGCARSYYFCLAGESVDECPASWGQCRSRCDAPSPSRGAPAA
ncbi:hypothetical protein [Phenylobacterium sp.]|uniref:hypothetical protein n=1 Tax=Phenylobacterium sp. TaxID=1871053 RepID=UPI002732C799|nr:hypothetical protein [Phenylobacterium sp.]MDP3855108.1 hypothetical protein [Phenylobacterium sp.]